MAGLSFSPSTSGRGRCKFSGDAFVKGEPRLGVTSHNTTAFVKLQYTAEVRPGFLARFVLVSVTYITVGAEGCDGSPR